MVDINTNASALQSQLQAQLQARTGKNGTQAPKTGLNLTPKPQDQINERNDARQGRATVSKDRSLPVKTSDRSSNLSSQADIEEAGNRAARFGTQREAPIGRLSVQAGQQRNVPLGQIVDILV